MDKTVLFGKRDEFIGEYGRYLFEGKAHKGFCGVIAACSKVVNRLTVHQYPRIVEVLFPNDVFKLGKNINVVVILGDVLFANGMNAVIGHSIFYACNYLFVIADILYKWSSIHYDDLVIDMEFLIARCEIAYHLVEDLCIVSIAFLSYGKNKSVISETIEDSTADILTEESIELESEVVVLVYELSEIEHFAADYQQVLFAVEAVLKFA